MRTYKNFVNVHRLVSVVKMPTMLEEYTVEDQSSFARFLWTKGPIANVIHKEVFLIYCWKCLPLKAVNNSVAGKWLRQQSKYFYAAGFNTLVMRWDKCVNVGGGYVEK
jgi:hypothetical protein